MICTVCPVGCDITVDENGEIFGYRCKRGITFAKKELINPVRPLSATVRIEGAILPRLPVKLDGEISREQMKEAVGLLCEVTITAPVKRGDIVLANVLGTGANFIATRDLPVCDTPRIV